MNFYVVPICVALVTATGPLPAVLECAAVPLEEL